ncbi:GntR family transcriptional regulator [Neobacillus niacini]|uniref:GntR family transcriptional regulator n=1 Tax=Neobacillus niacini TaxID=86668 RepID=UPI00203C3580|nr:GntR family transcriptional regulator [Neobacillus niacini]MCM3689706.1 GntR family transcriptional regulator [Neobacillus niacini]
MKLLAETNINNKRSIREHVYTAIKTQILKLELEPGRKISEKDIGETLQVSRTPIREAFLKLEQEELLEIYPQRGTFVSRINLDQVEEARFMRENIERGIVRLACEQFPEDYFIQLETNITMQKLFDEKKNFTRLYELDDQFHQILFDGCKKSRTWAILQQMNTHFNRVRALRTSLGMKWDFIINQHEQIFNLIKSRDVDLVEKVITEHLQVVVFEKAVLKEKYPNYFK